MAAKERKDEAPWTPRIDGQPVFTNPADYERGLGEGSNPLNADFPDEPETEESTVFPPPQGSTIEPGR